MLYAKLETEDTLYVFLHAEQVYRNFSLCDKHLGYWYFEIGESTVRDIFQYLEKNAIPKNVVIDCVKITTGHNISTWIEKIIGFCHQDSKNLVFCRMSETLYEASKIHGKGLQEESDDTDSCYNVYNSECTKKSISDDKIYSLYQETIAKRIKDKYIIKREGEASYSHSSNVQLPQYINIKSFIEEKDISFLGLYLLCKKVLSENLIGYNKQPLLFFSSLAGSYLASVFSKLACIDMVFLNHLGPKKILYRELHKEQLLADRDYLIISDVVCLGAEIERAKTLIEHAGGKLIGIISVVLVEVVKERPKVENEIEKVALLTLTKDYNPIDYQIKTDFQ